MQTFNAAISKMVTWILWTSPVGVASLIAASICRACSLWATLGALGLWVLTVVRRAYFWLLSVAQLEEQCRSPFICRACSLWATLGALGLWVLIGEEISCLAITTLRLSCTSCLSSAGQRPPSAILLTVGRTGCAGPLGAHCGASHLCDRPLCRSWQQQQQQQQQHT